MIVYGRNMYGGKGRVKGVTHCQKCCKYTKNTSYLGRMYWHVFLIPLIPDGPRVRVIKECCRCGNGQHVPEEELPATVASLNKQAQYALAELINGQVAIMQDGEEVSAVFSLVNLVETMCVFDMGKELAVMSASLKEREMMQVHHLMDGRMMEFKGNIKGARAAYEAASGHQPEDARVYMLLARICMRLKDVRGARDAYHKALLISSNRYPIFLELLKVYKATKEWFHLAGAYEECFKIRPDLARDGSSYKAYTNACKHGGKQPVAVLDF